MAEVLEFNYTAITDWVPNLLISLWAGVVLLLVGVVLVGALQYMVFRQIFIRGRFLRVVESFIAAKSFRANEDEWLPNTKWCNLPEDLLIDEILSRLPVKSLMRFKSVCKRWHSLPTNPSFIALHLKQSNTSNMLSGWNPTNLKDSISNTYKMLSCWNSYNDIICFPYYAFQPVNLNFGFDRKPDLVLGPCEGLFCLCWRPSMFYPRRRRGQLIEQVPTIALWNPATRTSSILPMSKLDLPTYKVVYYCHVRFGFGFDLKTKSIKVVKVTNLRSNEATDYQYVNHAEVYDLVSGSWRVLHVDDTLQQVFVLDDPTHHIYNNSDGVFHWHSYGKSRGNIRYHSLVLSFDMSRELFHVTRMPEKCNTFRTFFHFSVLRDSLAVNFSFLKSGHETITIWVMKKDFHYGVEAGESFSSYSWSHELTVDLPHLQRCLSTGFWSKNELLLWKIDEDLTLRTPVLYDIVTKQARDLGELNFTYKESLVSVKGGCGNNSIPCLPYFLLQFGDFLVLLLSSFDFMQLLLQLLPLTVADVAVHRTALLLAAV